MRPHIYRVRNDPHVVTGEKPWQRDFSDVQRQELHK